MTFRDENNQVSGFQMLFQACQVSTYHRLFSMLDGSSRLAPC